MNPDPTCDFIAERNHAVRPATTVTKLPAQRPGAAAATCGSGWYHDVAIQETQRPQPRKH